VTDDRLAQLGQALRDALAVAQKLRLLHEKVPDQVKPFEIGTAIAELDEILARCKALGCDA